MSAGSFSRTAAGNRAYDDGGNKKFFLRKMAYEQNNNSASVPFLDVYCVMDYDAKLPGSARFFS